MAFSITNNKSPSESGIPPGLWQIGTQWCLNSEEKKYIGREIKVYVFSEVIWCLLTPFCPHKMCGRQGRSLNKRQPYVICP